MQSAQDQANDEIVSADADRQKKLVGLLTQLGEERAALRKKSEQLDDIQMRFFNEFVAGGATPSSGSRPEDGRRLLRRTSTGDSRHRTMMSASIGSAILLISILEIVEQAFGYHTSPMVIKIVAAIGVGIAVALFAVFATRSRSIENAEG